MSYLPDCRSDAYYNQRFLNDKDKEFVRGFDWCVESGVDLFFSNNYDYSDWNTDGYLSHILAQQVPEELRVTYTMDYTFDSVPQEERTVQTYADLLRLELLRWIETERNELITAMIDHMSDEEYAENGGKTD